MMYEVAVVVPSYRDIKHISILIEKIFNILPQAKIIVVDDSPYLENQKIKKIIDKEKNVKLISRFKKLGRGSAIISGFKEVLKNTDVGYVFEIDSDLAHDPEEIPRFLDKLKEKKFDVIIGSRYISGGRTINIVLSRVILSRIINLFLRVWLNIKLTDFTGGFRLYSRKSVEFLSTVKLKANGFIMLSEVIFLLHRSGFKIGEVPITVSIKKEGKSNADINEFLTSLVFIVKMRITDIHSNLFRNL